MLVTCVSAIDAYVAQSPYDTNLINDVELLGRHGVLMP